MKKTKTNIGILEKFVKAISKGYYPNFNEYNPDHTKIDTENDHSKEEEENDHSYPNKKENEK